MLKFCICFDVRKIKVKTTAFNISYIFRVILLDLCEKVCLLVGLLSLHVYTATFRVAAIHVYKIGLPFKLVLA